MEQRTIKVVWVCHFSSERVRQYLKLTHRYSLSKKRDFGLWNVNAIKQFEEYKEISLHVIFPHVGLSKRSQSFTINGINYHCFRSEDDFIITKILKKLFSYKTKNYRINRKYISSVISSVKPEVVHVIGAENPYYSLCALDIPKQIPCIVSLQTLMSTPSFLENFPISADEYNYRTNVERLVINRANYIASGSESYKNYIRNYLRKDAVFLNLNLAVGVDIDKSESEKKYDFVYFANDISKAADYAVEAFAIALSRQSKLTLNISGGFSADYKEAIDKRINELGISKSIFFTGLQETHDNVIKQIKKSRFALLPLKVDIISSTIREAMACGLPVITTVTPGTPKLNEKRESVLLSNQGDFDAMADNMLKILNDESYAKLITMNAYETIDELSSNESRMRKWKRAYYEIVDNVYNGTPVSNDIISF